MRAREFIVEYDRNITARHVGYGITKALAKDNGRIPGPEHMESVRASARAIIEHPDWPMSQDQEHKDIIITLILMTIEGQDPTPNKVYTPWLAKMYAKGGLKLEDMNRNDLLRLYDIAKKRRMIKPEHADINRFKSYNEFERTMDQVYDSLDHVEQGREEKLGKASKIYEDDTVTIVVPHDEAAACRYGRNTNWCTAATRGTNYFDSYNRQGKMYILLPKKPEYPDEKYQLHFASGQYMDETDSSVNLNDLITKRFPNLRDFFLSEEPSLKDTYLLVSEAELGKYIEKIAQYGRDKLSEIISEWEADDYDYYQYLRDQGYEDEHGDIDWDRAYNNNEDYLHYNPEANRFYDRMSGLLDISPSDVTEFLEEEQYLYNYGRVDLASEIDSLPLVIAEMIRTKLSRREDDGELNEYIRNYVRMRKEKDHYKVYTL